MPEDTERWKNQTRSTAFVFKYDRYRNIISEAVDPGREVVVTKEEREINQERAVSKDLDIFSNGILTPLKLVDPDDQREFAENPALLSNSELEDILKLPKKAFEARIKEISSVYPLQRLKDLTQQEDTKVTVGVVQALDARLEELRPPRPKMKSFADDITSS